MVVEFDDRLQQRLIAFQQHHGIPDHGVADRRTWAKLTEGARRDGGVDARLTQIVGDVRALAAAANLLPSSWAARFAPLRPHMDAGMHALTAATAESQSYKQTLVGAFTATNLGPVVAAASAVISPGAVPELVGPALEPVLGRLLPVAVELLAPFLPEIIIVLVVVLVILWIILEFSGPGNRPDVRWLPAPAPAPGSTPRPVDPPASGPRDRPRRTPNQAPEPRPGPGPGPVSPPHPGPDLECVPWSGSAEMPRVLQDYLDRIPDTWEAIQAEERRRPTSRTRTGITGFLLAKVHCEQANAACVAVVDANNCVLGKAYGQFWKGRAPHQHAEQEAMRALDVALAVSPQAARGSRIKIVCTKEPCSAHCIPAITAFTTRHHLAPFDEDVDFTKVNKGSYPIREANAVLGL